MRPRGEQSRCDLQSPGGGPIGSAYQARARPQPLSLVSVSNEPDGLRDDARRGGFIALKRFSSSPLGGERAATGDWGLNCVGHPRNSDARGDVRERWPGRSPIERPWAAWTGGSSGDAVNHARPLGSHSQRHTRSLKAPQARAEHLIPIPSRGWGPCARVPQNRSKSNVSVR